MADDSQDIDARTLLDHMRGMEGRLTERIDGVERNLSKRIGGLENQVDRVEANLARQIEGVDERLDAVEIEKLPDRVKRIEAHVGLVAT